MFNTLPERTLEIRRSVLNDLWQCSQTGAPPLGHLVGLHRVPAIDGSLGLALDEHRPAMAGRPGILEVVMLADLALGGVIRNRIGLSFPMPTISMTIQLTPGRISEVARAEARSATPSERTASAHARLLTADGEAVGDAQGLFSLPPMPYQGPRRTMPWDSFDGLGNGTHMQEHDQPENGIIEDITGHALSRPTRAWGTAHVGHQMTRDGEFSVLTPTAVMANRLGHVQGGVLVTAAILAAAVCGGFPPESLAAATIDFLDAADLRSPIRARPSVLRQTKRSLFADVLLLQGPQTRCHVSAVFRR
jgi:acyl-coenzyme A thioesterase PaaI-like protein